MNNPQTPEVQTREPWEVWDAANGDDDPAEFRIDAGNEIRAWVYTEADAYLMAAAPRLLDAVKAYDRWVYEVGSARANGESIYSYTELQAMRDEAVELGRAALAAIGAQP